MQGGLLFVFSGASGAGKNTIMHDVMKAAPQLHQLPTATTRAPRDNEQQGREHLFLTEAEFRDYILQKKLIEWQIIHDKGVYGVPRQAVQDVIRENRLAVADVDVLGAMDLKREFADHVVLIFVQTPDKATLEKRLRERPDVDTEQELMTRLRRSDFEMSFAPRYDHIITNRDGQLDESVDQTLAVIEQVSRQQHPSATHNMGWHPDDIHYQVTGLVLHNGCLLMQNGQFPRCAVPPDKLPFEALQNHLHTTLNLEVLPTRQHANQRAVDISFEPPQLAQITQKARVIERNHIYILQSNRLPDKLNEHWQLAPINHLHLDEAIQHLLFSTMERLRASEQ